MKWIKASLHFVDDGLEYGMDMSDFLKQKTWFAKED